MRLSKKNAGIIRDGIQNARIAMILSVMAVKERNPQYARNVLETWEPPTILGLTAYLHTIKTFTNRKMKPSVGFHND